MVYGSMVGQCLKIVFIVACQPSKVPIYLSNFWALAIHLNDHIETFNNEL